MQLDGEGQNQRLGGRTMGNHSLDLQLPHQRINCFQLNKWSLMQDTADQLLLTEETLYVNTAVLILYGRDLKAEAQEIKRKDTVKGLVLCLYSDLNKQTKKNEMMFTTAHSETSS